MIDAKVIQLLNDQVNKEFYSAYLYLEFANYFSDKGLGGFANWYRIQAKEEMDHAMMFYDYLQENNEKVKLEAIDKPKADIKDTLDVLKKALAHEEYITASIDNIYNEANTKKDFRTTNFLAWLIKEQGEEEANANDLIVKMELFGQDPRSLYLLDAELKTRQYFPPNVSNT